MEPEGLAQGFAVVETCQDDLIREMCRQALALQTPRLRTIGKVDSFQPPGLGAVPSAAHLEDADPVPVKASGQHDGIHRC